MNVRMSKILVIDDDTIILNLLSIHLERNGYKVFTAFNGSEGIKLAKEIKPDLILCDILMPGMNGFEVLNKIQSDKETELIPFIFISAVQEREQIREGINLGADDYLTKPIDIKDLTKSVETRLKKKERILSHIVPIQNSNIPTTSADRLTIDDKIFVSADNETRLVNVKDIVAINSDAAKTYLFLKKNDSFLVNKLLKVWEEILPESHFIRIHRSAIINIQFIERVEKDEKNSLIVYLQNMNYPIAVSRRYSPKLKNLIKKL